MLRLWLCKQTKTYMSVELDRSFSGVFKKSNIPEARQTLKIPGVTIRSHIISFRFLPISGHFWATQKNQNWLIWSRKISCNWGNFFFFSIISKGKIFRADPKKSSYRCNYWWADVYSTILVITKIYLFLLLYFASVLLLTMRSQPASITWTSTAAFYHCWSYREHSVFWIRCVEYIWY